ncbi:ABC transporter substrate-binding protein [Crocosphaera sp. UHCC 0190]|uniref:ABC transporter substrate-binding protein n=1 Tax=Crocosphaera sp. UHCC 0190 TaxID=3110246 RepID=UPI002B21EBA4|nr:ABC transporter substrate-binding protein [Crocosphaera sp. UHCC 0190]MEA5510152.1 ABC transporter substrate-binding protein [Crocosphaera sp. UHCC 0190]
MTQKNETPILILSLLITAGILGGGYWYFTQKSGETTSNNPPQLPNNNQVNSRISLGDELLIAADSTPQKKAGIAAFKQGNYTEAIAQFKDSLNLQQNDPETRIYLNNAKAATNNPITIAVVVPIGGNLNIAKEMLRGVAQAQNQVNQEGGINGKSLQVVIVNDDNNPETAAKIANELVQDNSILAVVGHNSSDATLGAAPIYEKGQLVMISPTSDAKQISTLGDYIFRTVPSIRFQADQLSRYLINTAKKTNIAICFDSSAEYSKSLKEEFTSAIFADGGKVIEINCDLEAANFNALDAISEATKQGADSLLLIPTVNNINPAIEVAQANQNRLLLLGSSTLYTFETLKAGQKAVTGMILAVPWYPDTVGGNGFISQAKQLWGGDVNWRTASAYDATMAIITALKQGNLDRQSLQKNLSNPNFSAQGAGEMIKFLPSGDRNGGSILITIIPGNKSSTGFDFVPLK